MNPLFVFDSQHPYSNLVGVDEAGRGPLAGPVYAAAVILGDEPCPELARLNDSKKLSPLTRKELSIWIKQSARDYAVAWADHLEIDLLNIHHASLLAMRRAVEKLKTTWDFLFIDGKFCIPEIPTEKQRAIVKGDGKSACIAAASILAKVSRDECMEDYHKEFPEYEFAQHKGYGTALHFERLKKHGPCPIHRKTFCSKILSGAPE